MPEQLPFAAIEFAANPEPRCPCVLLLDTSASMAGQRLTELQQGIQDELTADLLARKRVELAVLTFGGTVRMASDFVTVDGFDPPQLHADGLTPMGGAIMTALDLVRSRKAVYRQNGIAYYRPWVFLLTDGEPSDQWQTAARLVRESEQQKALAFFAVGVGEANLDVLKQISTRAPLMLKGVMFREMFQWLSTSLKSVSQSSPTDELPLRNPAAPEGWAKV
jgi:uncharacterized protein YegL